MAQDGSNGIGCVLEELSHKLRALASKDAGQLLEGQVGAQALSMVAAIKTAAEQLEASLLAQGAPQVVLRRTDQGAVETGPSLEVPLVASEGPKLVSVPVRKRSGMAPGMEPVASFRQVQLPRTPYAPKLTDEQDKQPTPCGLPATTPVAAEVLASLGFGPVAQSAANLQQEDQQPNAALASILGEGLAAAPLAPAYRAAAAAAAAAGAGPVSRPRPSGERRVGCNCKRSMCLKMYCDCFAAGGFCAPGCTCMNCLNGEAHLDSVTIAREVILAKDPRAFEVKVTAANGHKRGCKCKRSKCLKKYCECFTAGALCNPDICGCEGCHNTSDDAVAAAMLNRGGSGITINSDEGAPSSGDDDYVPTVLAKRGPAARRGKQSRQGSLATAPPPPLPFMLEPLQQQLLPQLPAGMALQGAGPEAAAAAAAAAMFASVPVPGQELLASFAPAPGTFMLNPLAAAAAAAATYAAAATMAEQAQLQQQVEVFAIEESMADAALHAPAEVAPAAAAAAAALPAADSAILQAGRLPATTPAAARKMASALTSHLSDVMDLADSEMRDTASSPAPHLAVAKLAARRGLLAETAALTGGGAAMPMSVAGSRPPLPPTLRQLPSAGNSLEAGLSLGSAGDKAEGSLETSASQQHSKRPRRAASGGVLGAVAAEAAGWAVEDALSPPLKRANSLPTALGALQRGAGAASGAQANRKQVAERMALLRKALAGDAAANCMHQWDTAPSKAAGAAEDDAVSALFQLSSSMC